MKEDPKQSEGAKQASEGKRRRLGPVGYLLRGLVWALVVILALPALLYVGPVQTFVKNVVCQEVAKSTGMQIGIERLRLLWPLKLNLEGVNVVEATGDTMVEARRVVADVKILPLFKLDVKLKKLLLEGGYYRMVSEDSSMVMRLWAKHLEAGAATNVNLVSGKLFLDDVKLDGADVRLYMNVWRQIPKPSEPGKFIIEANRVSLSDFRFAMSMLPTIDTLDINGKSLQLLNGKIDLKNNKIAIASATVSGGGAKLLMPTAEYVKTHPAPAASPYPSVPMEIRGDSIGVENFAVLYATKGAKPVAGFDASYISLNELNLGLRDFYNRASSIVLPITRLEGKERSGIQITSGKGTVGVDSVGLRLDNLSVRTLFSKIKADAFVAFGMMAMQEDAPMNIKADASIGIPDINSFMPSIKEITRLMPGREPIELIADAEGTLSNLNVSKLNLSVGRSVSLAAQGHVANVMRSSKMDGKLNFEGKVANPSLLQRLARLESPTLPPFILKGTAIAHHDTYGANFTLRTPEGSLAGKGDVSLNSERYMADISINRINVEKLMPTMGIGMVSGHIMATGAGFNPTLPGARTDIKAEISELGYGKADLGGIELTGSLSKGVYNIDMESVNPLLLGHITATGTVRPDEYTADVVANLRNFNAYALGLSTDTMRGSGVFTLSGSASPSKWLYDATLSATQLELELPSYYLNLPKGIDARLYAGMDTTMLVADAEGMVLDFHASSGLQGLMAGFSKSMETIATQLQGKRLDVEQWQPLLPAFALNFEASGSGVARQLLDMSGVGVDSVRATLRNDSLLSGNASVYGLVTSSMQIDTIGMQIGERNGMLDYALHVGNKGGNMDEFHEVNAAGYIGGQRASLYLNQKNLAGETGYRLGFTAAFTDSLLTLHFTPLKATIAYMPWVFNDDNYIDYDFGRRISANLKASSKESSISICTQKKDSAEYDPVLVNLHNIKIQDFLGLVPDAPHASGEINADIKIGFNKRALIANGNFGVENLIYENTRIGDLGFDIKAGLNTKGQTAGRATLSVNSHKALTIRGILRNDSTPIRDGDITVELTRLPLTLANAFIPSEAARLSGTLSGKLGLTGSLVEPLLKGWLAFDSTSVYLPIMGGRLQLDNDSLHVENNKVAFEDFNIWGANKNPISLNGEVNAAKLSAPTMNLNIGATNFMLIDNDKRAGSDIYGKILLTLSATARGPLNLLDVNGDLNILSGTNAFYTLSQTQQMAEQGETNVVKFVNFADTAQVAEADSVIRASLMRITATVNISNGVQATVNLSDNGTDKVQLTPYGELTFFQNFMGDMHLNGRLNLGNGFARYSMPVIGEKRFTINPESYVAWGGDIMNPSLHVLANDEVKSVVQTSQNNTRVVDFNIMLQVTNTLSYPNVMFDLSTEDLTIENELQSMSADQRSSEAMNMLLYGRYMGPGAANGGSGNIVGNALYSFLEGQLNSWAANNIRGVDLTFGIDQSNTMDNGKSDTSTSYSYQVSKTLFNNKFKIIVGGNYNTDASSDENFAQNLISDISFQYMLRQTNTMNMYLTLFRHNDYENILEGEVTETGVGYVMQRKLSNLRQLFSWLRPKKRKKKSAIATDTDSIVKATTIEAPDPKPTTEP